MPANDDTADDPAAGAGAADAAADSSSALLSCGFKCSSMLLKCSCRTVVECLGLLRMLVNLLRILTRVLQYPGGPAPVKVRDVRKELLQPIRPYTERDRA